MKIMIAGAPGSGKTWLARHLEVELNLYHIEGDSLYWEQGREVLPEKFRLAVREDIQKKNWVYEGHLAKVFDILITQSPLLIVIRERTLRDLGRTMLKDLKASLLRSERKKALSRIRHHLKHWNSMKEKRLALTQEYAVKFPHRCFFWDGNRTSLNDLVQSLKKQI